MAAAVTDGKYLRRFVLQDKTGSSREIDIGRVIAAYIDTFDRALKTFFYHLEAPSKAAAGVESIYRRYVLENGVLI